MIIALAAYEKYENSANQENGWIMKHGFCAHGEPYVAIEDSATGQVRVIKFDGTNWVNVGESSGFTGQVSQFICLAFSPSGQPYVSYQMVFVNGDIGVMKFDGTSWVQVGTTGFINQSYGVTSLAFNLSGEPYVAFKDPLNYGFASVMKFDGTNWVYVGSMGFSAALADYVSLSFSPLGEPFVAFNDEGYSYKATVMKFNGTNWINVGSGGFSAEIAKYLSLAFSPSGYLNVAYSDASYSYKATVMKYDSVYAGINEPQVSTFSVYPNPATDKITLETTGTIEGCKLVLINVAGQELISQQVSERKTVIDITTLPSGVYFVRLTNERMVKVGKIIKQ